MREARRWANCLESGVAGGDDDGGGEAMMATGSRLSLSSMHWNFVLEKGEWGLRMKRRKTSVVLFNLGLGDSKIRSTSVRSCEMIRSIRVRLCSLSNLSRVSVESE